MPNVEFLNRCDDKELHEKADGNNLKLHQKKLGRLAQSQANFQSQLTAVSGKTLIIRHMSQDTDFQQEQDSSDEIKYSSDEQTPKLLDSYYTDGDTD
jgi:hypothetical protein